MKAVHCPIDTSLNFNQAKKLIRDLRPGMIAVPEQYLSPPPSAPSRTDLVLDDLDVPCHTFGRFENIELPVKKTLQRIDISPKLASKLRPVEVRPGISAVSLAGNLTVMNNK